MTEENAGKMNRNYLCSVEASVYICNLEKVKSPRGSKEIRTVNPKGNQP